MNKGLGRGLDALMGAIEEPAMPTASLPVGVERGEDGSLWVSPDLLKPNPHQPRQEFKDDSLNELAESIRQKGIVQPVMIEEAEGGAFYIIAGERRVRAARIAGLERVPVRLVHYNESEKLEVALVENIQRSDLNPMEEARAYRSLMEMSSLNQDEAAQKVGKKRSTVANALRLLKLPDDMQNAVSSGQITAGHARALLSIDSDSERRVLFGRIIGDGLSVRETERLASESGKSGNASKKKAHKTAVFKDPDITAIEQKFMELFGTKVILKGNLQRGTLQIEYYSRDDLDRLYSIAENK